MSYTHSFARASVRFSVRRTRPVPPAAPSMRDLVLECPDEPLRHAVALRLAHEGSGTLDLEERDFVLELLRDVVRAVIVPQNEAVGTPAPKSPMCLKTAMRICSSAARGRRRMRDGWRTRLSNGPRRRRYGRAPRGYSPRSCRFPTECSPCR